MISTCNNPEYVPAPITFIHYGTTKINKKELKPIENRLFRNKPHNGFWGSPINSKFGWKDWCSQEDFRKCKIENSIKFKFKRDAMVVVINNYKDLDMLPCKETNLYNFVDYEIDFVRMLKNGIDAIYLTLEGFNELSFSTPKDLYGWDCESVLVLNINSIIEIKNG